MFTISDIIALRRAIEAARTTVTMEGGVAWLPGRRVGLRAADGPRGSWYSVVGYGGSRLSMPIDNIAEAVRTLVSTSASLSRRAA